MARHRAPTRASGTASSSTKTASSTKRSRPPSGSRSTAASTVARTAVLRRAGLSMSGGRNSPSTAPGPPSRSRESTRRAAAAASAPVSVCSFTSRFVSRSSSAQRPVTRTRASTKSPGSGGSSHVSTCRAWAGDISSTRTHRAACGSTPGIRVVTRRTHRWPPSRKGASCSCSQTSSRTRSVRGRASSSRPRWAPASAGSSKVAVSPVMKRVASATLAATATGPRTSRPIVTTWIRPRKRRRTRRCAQTAPASTVLPKPPAPSSAVVMPTAVPRPHTAATATSRSDRSTTQSGTSGTGGGGGPAAEAVRSWSQVVTAASSTPSTLSAPTAAHAYRRSQSSGPGQSACDVAGLTASPPSTATTPAATATSSLPRTVHRPPRSDRGARPSGPPARSPVPTVPA